MKKSDLSEFEIQDQEFKLRIKRDVGGRTAVAPVAAPVAAPAPVAATPVAAPVAAAPVAADPNVKVITSPMVGTFYATPSPDSPNFVAISDATLPPWDSRMRRFGLNTKLSTRYTATVSPRARPRPSMVPPTTPLDP